MSEERKEEANQADENPQIHMNIEEIYHVPMGERAVAIICEGAVVVKHVISLWSSV